MTTEHLRWLTDTGERLQSADGLEIAVWRLNPQDDENILSSWAAHFRAHYCLDEEIDDLRSGYGLSKRDYLLQYVFPDATAAPGPSIRSGDFAEILVGDYLQHVLGYWVPRWRYDDKPVRNESTKGTDLIGFRLAGPEASPDDELAVYEAKATLTGRGRSNRLEDALAGSATDFNVRRGESLNAIRRRLLRAGQVSEADTVKRFQDRSRRPYLETSGAAVLLHDGAFDRDRLCSTDCATHPNRGGLKLLAITGSGLMALVHALYAKAADDA